MDDLELLRAYAKHRDVSALSLLIRKHQRAVFIACWHKLRSVPDAEDASQDVFLALVEHSGDVHSNVGAWLHRCAINTANAMLRSRRNRHRWEFEKTLLQGAGGTGGARGGSGELPADNALHEHIEFLDSFLQELGADDHELLVENCVHGTNQQQLASKLGMSQQTVSKRLTRIVAQLRHGLRSRGVVGSIAMATVLSVRRTLHAAFSPRASALLSQWASTPEQLRDTSAKVAFGIKIVTASGILLIASSAEQQAPQSRSAGLALTSRSDNATRAHLPLSHASQAKALAVRLNQPALSGQPPRAGEDANEIPAAGSALRSIRAQLRNAGTSESVSDRLPHPIFSTTIQHSIALGDAAPPTSMVLPVHASTLMPASTVAQARGTFISQDTDTSLKKQPKDALRTKTAESPADPDSPMSMSTPPAGVYARDPLASSPTPPPQAPPATTPPAPTSEYDLLHSRMEALLDAGPSNAALLNGAAFAMRTPNFTFAKSNVSSAAPWMALPPADKGDAGTLPLPVSQYSALSLAVENSSDSHTDNSNSLLSAALTSSDAASSTVSGVADITRMMTIAANQVASDPPDAQFATFSQSFSTADQQPLSMSFHFQWVDTPEPSSAIFLLPLGACVLLRRRRTHT